MEKLSLIEDKLDMASYRQAIDRIDHELVSLLKKRQRVSTMIGHLKEALGQEVLDPDREKVVIRRAMAQADSSLPPEAIKHVFLEIIAASRLVQKPMDVSFLGPEGTYSHEAAVSLFGQSSRYRVAENIDKVFESVDRGESQRGVVPIENSCEGTIGRTIDLLFQFNLKISAESYLRIRHHLLSESKAPEEIRTVSSHLMALAQCRNWLRENLDHVDIQEAKSSAEAVRAASGRPQVAAIGSRLASRLYDLPILASNIEDNTQNVTRFLVIGPADAKPTGRDKTSLLFSLRHQPGALYTALQALAKNKINMTRIESRPTRIRNWEYLFCVDLEGHIKDPIVSAAVSELNGYCVYMKLLGSYPCGSEPWK